MSSRLEGAGKGEVAGLRSGLFAPHFGKTFLLGASLDRNAFPVFPGHPVVHLYFPLETFPYWVL
jgi:hypothetical protein